MDNKTYRKIQKLILLFVIAIGIMLNIRSVSAFAGNILSMFTPFVVGICIAFILNLPMQKIEELTQKFLNKKSRGLSIVLSLLSFIIVVGLVFSMIIPEIINSFKEIRNGLPGAISNLEDFLQNPNNPILKNISGLGIDFDKLANEITNFFQNLSFLDATNALQSVYSATTNVFGVFMNFFLGLIFAIYILSQKETLLEQATSLIKAVFGEEKSKGIVEFFELVNSSFSKFIAGQGTEAVILSLLFLISMTVLGIPKAVSIAAIIGLFSLVPIVGAFIAAGYGVVSILIVSPIKAVWFIVLFLILQQIEGNLIYPRVVGKSVGLPGIWVLLAITVGGSLAGITGMIMAVPTMSIIYILVASFVRKSKNTGNDGSIYERYENEVNAGDDEEEKQKDKTKEETQENSDKDDDKTQDVAVNQSSTKKTTKNKKKNQNRKSK